MAEDKVQLKEVYPVPEKIAEDGLHQKHGRLQEALEALH